jgi:hypothetical protein
VIPRSELAVSGDTAYDVKLLLNAEIARLQNAEMAGLLQVGKWIEEMKEKYAPMVTQFKAKIPDALKQRFQEYRTTKLGELYQKTATVLSKPSLPPVRAAVLTAAQRLAVPTVTAKAPTPAVVERKIFGIPEKTFLLMVVAIIAFLMLRKR